MLQRRVSQDSPTTSRDLSDETREALLSWSKHDDDDEAERFCVVDGQCVEKRAFYRLISGLHASINIHLSARYLLDDSWFQKKWGHNVSEFRQRFDAELTAGEGPKRLRNLYFLYLIELQALAKAVLPAAVLPAVHRQTRGGPETQRAAAAHPAAGPLCVTFPSFRSFPLHFDETSLFAGDENEAAKLKVGNHFRLSKIILTFCGRDKTAEAHMTENETPLVQTNKTGCRIERNQDIRLAFLNISRIMDCVGCFKCRLWGKLQARTSLLQQSYK
ncbi:hypothetical protein L3Q82_008480 [Scortum barcoo]|uniref:Uncharacterized protein n=1 Tax=Scortum barcoo TaxID=214431 RepID=A0ACB8XA79_9TELE|nr:hypothetical protein L3Q82_008480 [Scortum barcoo]